MEKEDLIPVDACRMQYHIEHAFIHALEESGLIEVVYQEEDAFIPAHQLQELEMYVRLHDELEINLEGLEAIGHMLQRMKVLQQELQWLRNRLSLYEPLVAQPPNV